MGLKRSVRPGDSQAARSFQLAQWIAAREITQTPAPFQLVTGTPGKESTIQHKKKGLRGREPGDQAQQVPPLQKQMSKEIAIGNVQG